MARRLYRASRIGLWLPAIIALFIAFVPISAGATNEPGLIRTVYDYRPNGYNQYDNAPPLPSVSGIQPTGSSTVTRVEDNFDQSPPFGLYEDFVVNYQGYITAPISGSIMFWPQGDDGTKLLIDNILVQDDWRDKGGGGEQSSFVQFEAGISQPFEMWFYENGGGAWTNLYWDIGNGWEIVPDSAFTQQSATTTTTTVAPYFNAPINLNANVENNQVTITWEAGEASNVEPHMWNITWFEMDSGEQSGGWGIWTYANILTATITLGADTSGYGDTQFTVSAGTASCVGEGQGSCMYGPTAKVNVNVPVPTTTTTSSTTTTTSIPETTTSVEPEDPPTPTLPQELETPQTSISPQEPYIEEQEPQEPTQTTLPEQQLEKSPVDSTSDSSSGNEETPQTLVTEEQVNIENIGEISSEEITPEIAEKLVDVLINGDATEEQIIDAVAELIDSESFSPELAAELATSPDVLESITSEQAEEIFSAIEESELTEEQAQQIIDSVQDAPEEVRETFEETVDLFGGTFDNYEMVGQTISVGERRTMVAVNLVAATAAATALSGGMSGPSGGSGGSSGGGSGGPSNGGAARKNEEDNEEQEMAGEIAGDGVNWVSALSIYKIVNGERVFNLKAFIKKFWLGVLNLGFTIAGSVVVYFTLSGNIQKIALISTLLAFVSSMYLHMKEPD